MMRCLRLSSFWLLLLAGCASPYKHLKSLPPPDISGLPYQPDFSKVLYRCQINGRFLIKRFHLSGILLFKQLAHGKRVVFQNEMGYSFFDFGWDKTDSFTVYSVIPQLNKPAVIKTLQKDLIMLLGIGMKLNEAQYFFDDAHLYYRFPLAKGAAWYIADNKANALTRIEATGKKVVTTIYPFWKGQQTSTLPDSVSVVHHNAHFTITAKSISDAGIE